MPLINDSISMSIDYVALLARTNQVLNQNRRNAIKNKLLGKLQTLASDISSGSKQLFDDELEKRIKTTSSTNSLTMLKSKYTRQQYNT